MNEYLVRDYMTREPIIAMPTTTLSEANRLMTHYSVRHLPIVEPDGRIVAIADRSVLRRAQLKQLAVYAKSDLVDLLRPIHSIADLHLPAAAVIRADSNVLAAVERLLSERCAALAVVENRRLVGIFTETDAYRLLEKVPALDHQLVLN